MTRPQWCPQDVWDRARKPARISSAPHNTPEIARAVIARAILAEHERCAAVADKIAAGRSRQKMEATTAKKRGEARDFKSMAMSAIDVAYSIRSGAAHAN